MPDRNKAYTVKRVTWQDAETDLRILREFVFIGEQNVPVELEWDGKDEQCVHILAQDKKGRGIGTARMTTEGHIGRMAVLRAWRNRGVGSDMLTALVTIARARQLSRVQLDAQTHAVEFYQRHDFIPQGGTFMDAGIPHQHMTRSLPPLDVHININDLPKQILGETRGYIDLKGRDDNQMTAIHMVSQATRSLNLFTPNLDPRIFNNEGFIDDVAVDKVVSFEASLLSFLKSNQADLMAKINKTGAFDKEIAAEMTAAIESFKTTGSW